MASLLGAAASGHSDAIRILDDVADGLARAVNIVTVRIDPDLIVLCGDLATDGSVVLPTIANALHKQAAPSPFLAGFDVADGLRHVHHVEHVGVVGAVLAAARKRR